MSLHIDRSPLPVWTMRSFGKFLARRKPVQLYCGAAAAADKGSLIRVLDPEIGSTRAQGRRHALLNMNMFIDAFPYFFIAWLNMIDHFDI